MSIFEGDKITLKIIRQYESFTNIKHHVLCHAFINIGDMWYLKIYADTQSPCLGHWNKYDRTTYYKWNSNIGKSVSLGYLALRYASYYIDLLRCRPAISTYQMQISLWRQ